MNKEKIECYKQNVQINLFSSKTFKIFMANIIVAFCFFSISITSTHYSADFFSTYFKSSAKQHLNLGRVFHYLIYEMLEHLGVQIEHHVIFNQIFLTFIIAILATIVWRLFATSFEIDNYKTAIILDAIVLLNFLNINILEGWYIFSETCFGGAISLTISYCAICSFCKGKTFREYLKSYIFLSVALGMYQVYIESFLIMCATYILIKNNCILNKQMCWGFGKIILVGGLASICSILLTRILEFLKISTENDRTASININTIIKNGSEIMNNILTVFDDYHGYMPKHSVLIFILLVTIIILLTVFKRDHVILRIITLLIFGVAILIAAYLPHFIVAIVWLAPRAILGVSTVLFSISLIAFFYVKQSHFKMYTLAATVILFLGVSFIQTQKIIVDEAILAGIEQENIHQLGEKIAEYETNTGNEIHYISYIHDAVYKWTFDPIKYNIYETNARRANVEWSFVNMINFYLNRSFEKKDVDRSRFECILGNDGKNWNYINLDEQMYFEGDTLYMVIY